MIEPIPFIKPAPTLTPEAAKAAGERSWLLVRATGAHEQGDLAKAAEFYHRYAAACAQAGLAKRAALAAATASHCRVDAERAA